MIEFFKEEFNVYRQMMFRESGKSAESLEILRKFVCNNSMTRLSLFRHMSMASEQLNHFPIKFTPYSSKRFAIVLPIPPAIMKSNGIFGCCRFVAKFWNRSIRKSKCWCHHSMRTFTRRWWKIRRKVFVCASTIGCAICRRIKLAIHSREPFHMCWMVKKNCVSSEMCHGLSRKSSPFPSLLSAIAQFDSLFLPPIPFDRQANVDFKDYLESAFKTVPAYGYMFAAELNQKFFRVIRIDSEVSWKSISMARFVSITAFLSFSHNDNTFNDLWIVFRIGIEYGIPCSPDWYWWNGSSITKCVEIQFEWTGKAASTAGNSLLRWKGMTMHFLFVFEFECFRE